MSNKRAEMRRLARENAKGLVTMSPVAPLSMEQVAKQTNTPLMKLLEWQKLQRESMEKEICKEYQEKLYRAEELIQAGTTMAAILAVRKAWKNPLNIQKYFDALTETIDETFNGGAVEGIKKAARRVQAMGLEFEFDDIDLNREFHLSDYDWRDDVDRCTPTQSYDLGWSRASVLGNIINTVLFAEYLLSQGHTAEEIQQVIIGCNKTAEEIYKGNRSIADEILHLREQGVDIGEKNLEIVKKYGL